MSKEAMAVAPPGAGAAAAHRPRQPILVAADGRRVTILQVELLVGANSAPALANSDSRQLVSTELFRLHFGCSRLPKSLDYLLAYLFCRQVTLAATIQRARTELPRPSLRERQGLRNAARQALLGERRAINARLIAV